MAKKLAKKLNVNFIVIVIISIFITGLVSQNTVFSASTLASNSVTKIMPLGDSITAVGNWHSLLLSQLTNSGYNVEFVGTQKSDTAHEGHGGISPINMANSGELVTWLSATNPDIVLMHLGTNNCWGTNRMTSEILASFTTLVGQMRANNPNMIIMVAKIIPMHPADAGELCNNNALDLNSSIDSWAQGLNTSQSPIIVVDQYTGFDTTTDTYDGVHPNDKGCIKIADKWFAALKNIFSPSTPTAVPTTLIMYGDVNGDNKIDSADYTLLRSYLLGKTNKLANMLAADTNADNVIDSADYTILRRYLLRIINVMGVKR